MAQATIRRPRRMAPASRVLPLKQIPTVSQTMQRMLVAILRQVLTPQQRQRTPWGVLQAPATPLTRRCWLPIRPQSWAETSLELAARSITAQSWFTKRPKTTSSLSLYGIRRRTPLRLAAQLGRRSARLQASPGNRPRLEPVQRRILARNSDLGNRRPARRKQRRHRRHHNRNRQPPTALLSNSFRFRLRLWLCSH